MTRFGHHNPINLANYRAGWRVAIQQRRRLMVIVGKGDRDAHIDHDWQTSVIAEDRAEHRADASRERAANIRQWKRVRALNLQAFIRG